MSPQKHFPLWQTGWGALYITTKEYLFKPILAAFNIYEVRHLHTHVTIKLSCLTHKKCTTFDSNYNHLQGPS